MAIYSISDIHVKPDGRNQDLLKQFLNLDFNDNDTIIFLGDIFDLVIGNHHEYLKKYDYFFNKLEEFKTRKIKVYFIEGNHDFHLDKLLVNFGVFVKTEPLKFNWNNSVILFCHGDEIEIGNISYKIYKAFIRSKPLNLIGNYLMPYSLLNYIGTRASAKSRANNKSRYGNPQNNLKIRDAFREAAKRASLIYQTNIIIAGHSHFRDEFIEGKLEYYNNGYNPYTKSYIKIDEKIEIVKFAGH